MRWDNLRLDDELAAGAEAAGGDTLFPPARRDVAVPLIERGAVARTFDTPGFRGMTFFEVQAKSVVNRVPEASRMAFRWTINPYRGCQHSCVYCFARKSHSYLELDTGVDFDTKVVVKVNAPELTRKKMASASWHGEHIAMGTNVDCYQRAEGRYQLMPGIIGALKDARDAVANAAGFRIQSISIAGRKQLGEKDILATAGVSPRTSLLFLDVSYNRLTTLPSTVGSLLALKTLRANNNALTELPRQLGKLHELSTLDVSANQLRYLPATLNRLRQLRAIIVDENPLFTRDEVAVMLPHTADRRRSRNI